MVKFIHMSDSHDETIPKLRAVAQFAKKNSIDALLHTGDLVDAEHVGPEIVKNLQRLPKPSEDLVARLQSKKASKEEQEQYMKLMQNYQAASLEPFARRYQAINNELKNSGLKEIVMNLGNHDSVIAYEIIKVGRFAELEDATLKGLKVKGMLNTWEVPKFYQPALEALGPLFENALVPFALGVDAGNDKELRKLHEEDIKRMLSGDKPDIIAMHKELYDPQGDKMLGSSAKEVLAKLKGLPVFCGHLDKTPSVARYGGHPYIRQSRNTFAVVDMNEKTKKINYVDIYAFVPKQVVKN